jgi:signal peptidase
VKSLLRRVPAGHLGLLALFALWAILLRPTWLGGTASYVLVRGDSMLPTHTNGELLFIQAQSTYVAGDVVAYRVPKGELGEGKLVVHRIVDTTGDGYVLRGDNNPASDPWHPTQSDVSGKVAFAVPMVGHIVAKLLSPAVAASLATALLVMIALARGGRASAEAIEGRAPAPHGSAQIGAGANFTAGRSLRNLRSTSR